MAIPVRHSRAPFARALAVALLLELAAMAPATAGHYRNLTLEQAIAQLEESGLSILYSSDLIKPAMLVRQEPTSTEPRAILEEILAPYGVAVVAGPNSSVVLVRARTPQPPATGRIVGTLRRAVDGAPVAGAVVSVSSNEQRATTDADGRFEFQSIPTGRHRLQVLTQSLQLVSQYVAEVRAESTAELRAEVFDLATPDLPEIIVTASRYQFVREPSPSVVLLSAADLQLLPAIGDDPLRSVARLPGAASGDFTAKANLRGGEADETLVRFDGLRLYNPFHLKDFQSAFSTVDPRIVGEVDIYTGGFPVEFGDRMSGVIDIHPLAPAAPPRREISLSSFNATALASGNFNADTGDWLVSARRGNLDMMFKMFDPALGDPSYLDVYGRLGRKVSDALRVSANVLVFDDDILLVDGDDEERARADYRDEYYWLRMDFQSSDRASAGTSEGESGRLAGNVLLAHSNLDSTRAGSVNRVGVARGSLQDRRSFSIDSLQTDWTWRLSDDLLLQFGGEWRSGSGRYDYRDEVEFDLLFLTRGASLDTSRTREVSVRPEGVQRGAYADLRVALSDKLTLEGGMRWDEDTLSSRRGNQHSPRLSALYEIGERTRLRASWGRFSQGQSITELQASDGVVEFQPAQRSNHLVASLDHHFANGVDFRVEAYRKDYAQIRPRYENLLNSFVLLPELRPDRIRIAPDGAATQGAEISVRRKDAEPLGWWFTYTWSSAYDRFDDAHTRRNWDQTHFVSTGMVWHNERWDLGLAARYHSGWPTTDAVLGEIDGVLVGVAERQNDAHLGAYFTLDARVARTFRFENAGTLNVFLEVSNLTNQINDCCVEHDIDAEGPEPQLDLERVHSLHLLPAAGFIWQF